MLWRDSAKDDSGYRAIFAEQVASASQVAAEDSWIWHDWSGKRRGISLHASAHDGNTQMIALARKKSAHQSGCRKRGRQIMGQVEKPFRSCDFEKVKAKSEVVQQAKKDGRSVHFASFMDLCLSFATSPKKTRREPCSGRTTSKTTVDTEQSYPSQVAAAKFLDAISRLPGMAGEVNDAVSFYETGACQKLPDRDHCQRKSAHKCGQGPPPGRSPSHRDSIERTSGLTGLLWGTKLEEVLLKTQ